MAKERDNATMAVGCVSASWSLFVQVPMWLFLMFGVLSTVEPPQWVWVLFWCYVPACLIGSFIGGVLKVFTAAD